MKQNVELPISEPVYGTYHYQGSASAILQENPDIRNWYLNQAVILYCNRRFLYGYTSPEISICDTSFWENPYLETVWFPMKYLGSSMHSVIRALLDDGYYVAFGSLDDYYIEGKSNYGVQHFDHDGLICGYDRKEKTYSVYAYDQSWVYRVFQTSWKSFEEARKSSFKRGFYGSLHGLKVKPDKAVLDPAHICGRLRDYLNSSLDKYPLYVNDTVFGIAVQDYIAMYLNKLADGSIPYERMDRRVMRVIWEHKKVMLERLRAVEDKLGLSHEISMRYEPLVRQAEDMRMLYASHRMKRRDSVLPVIRDKLIALRKTEELLLREFLVKAEAGGLS